MSRLSILIKRPRRTIGVLAAALAAIGVAIGSGAAFSSQSENPGNLFTAGVLKQANSKNGSAIATLDKILPGQEQSGSVTISNDGNVPAGIKFTRENTQNAAGSDQEACSGVDGGSAACSPLGDALRVEVKEGSTVLYDDLAKNLSLADFTLGTGASRTLSFRFYLPSGTGNAFQGGTYEAKYTFDASQQ
jgi:spore coat-associated protein N